MASGLIAGDSRSQIRADIMFNGAAAILRHALESSISFVREALCGATYIVVFWFINSVVPFAGVLSALVLLISLSIAASFASYRYSGNCSLKRRTGAMAVKIGSKIVEIRNRFAYKAMESLSFDHADVVDHLSRLKIYERF